MNTHDHNVKNYTSSVPVETTIARIEAKLAAIGALGIMKLYSPQKQVAALVFNIEWGEGAAKRPYTIRLPARVESCYQAMLKQHTLHHSRMHEGTKQTLREQATRTAWRVLQEWLEVQISLILIDQAEFLELFMSFIWDGKKTYFEYAKEQQFKMLPAPRE